MAGSAAATAGGPWPVCTNGPDVSHSDRSVLQMPRSVWPPIGAALRAGSPFQRATRNEMRGVLQPSRAWQWAGCLRRAFPGSGSALRAVSDDAFGR